MHKQLLNAAADLLLLLHFNFAIFLCGSLNLSANPQKSSQVPSAAFGVQLEIYLLSIRNRRKRTKEMKFHDQLERFSNAYI